MELTFYRCMHCGNLAYMINDSGVNMVCCGEKMQKLIPGTIEASTEKHIPVYNKENNKVYVNVGSVLHPMQDNHYIMWIALHTNNGVQIKYLKPNEEPKTIFSVLENDEIINVYAYCNIHGLWRA